MKEKKTTVPDDIGRRTAVKRIVGGFAALTAYHVLPVSWDTPIVDQIFLPAHAATSSVTTSVLTEISWSLTFAIAAAGGEDYNIVYTAPGAASATTVRLNAPGVRTVTFQTEPGTQIQLHLFAGGLDLNRNVNGVDAGAAIAAVIVPGAGDGFTQYAAVTPATPYININWNVT